MVLRNIKVNLRESRVNVKLPVLARKFIKVGTEVCHSLISLRRELILVDVKPRLNNSAMRSTIWWQKSSNMLNDQTALYFAYPFWSQGSTILDSSLLIVGLCTYAKWAILRGSARTSHNLGVFTLVR